MIILKNWILFLSDLTDLSDFVIVKNSIAPVCLYLWILFNIWEHKSSIRPQIPHVLHLWWSVPTFLKLRPLHAMDYLDSPLDNQHDGEPLRDRLGKWSEYLIGMGHDYSFLVRSNIDFALWSDDIKFASRALYSYLFNITFLSRWP